MPKGRLIPLLVLLLIAAGAVLMPTKGSSNGPTRVVVENLQRPHPVRGTVEVRNVIPHATLVRSEDIVVSPANLDETTQWTDAGILDAHGYTFLHLSLQGQLKGRPFREGSVGAILLPEEEPVLRSFREDGEVHLSLNSVAQVAAVGTYAFSDSRPSLPLFFPRYRVFLYNSTDKSAEVNLYFNLGN